MQALIIATTHQTWHIKQPLLSDLVPEVGVHMWYGMARLQTNQRHFRLLH
jgi:hypothetical protein